ncbi:MAG: oligopeptidase A [Gammaproteobacteria bacterium CG_4_10_14_0_8_um_filter_38_16]|nr:MAG: oligopeptidase A [Gammaproteobacteria bacterium CG_4_10_14_0_8_um_filter_38_16]PJA03937.1 MAG: oligopeptidase A [Gammaproteobacteria bacterium CG_4_10_14_0_2_um_filter_38_22]PJB09736.1 MAG: oligopeptidase A [Gammaproteobacteria bacterium CG_4_9_14_3_um_filter_38_9]
MNTVIQLPAFRSIQISHAVDDLNTLLKKNLQTIDALLNQPDPFTWENLLQPLENLNDALHQFWSPIQHLGNVMDSPLLRDTIRACLPLLSDYHTHISQNEKLFLAMQSIHDSSAFKTLSTAAQQSIHNDLRDFKLSGVHLAPDEKKAFATLSKKLSQLTHQFEENVLDATMSWKKHITDEKLLSGIPAHAKNAAKENAEKEKLPGWIFTLEAPDYLAVMTYADSVDLRFEMYQAYSTRASDCGPDANKFDNSDVMRDIMKTRFALSRLLGFNNYAEYSLATKMAKKPDEVLSFLNELAEKSLSNAKTEFKTLSEFAKEKLNLSFLNAWDIAYVSEKLRLEAYAISEEDLRPYFPEYQVMQGLFEITHRLYDVTFEKVIDADIWHDNVTCYRMLDAQKNSLAHLYFDLYARPNKRGGAWMDDCTMRRRLDDGRIQLPAAYVTCNFNAPIGNNPAFFTHADVETLFHECGHALQHVLTTVDIANVSGIHGIPWDAVEIASQFYENWAWEKDSIPYIAKHYQTQAELPSFLFERMQRAKHFQSAMQMMRQLELSLFDFHLHMHYDDTNQNAIQSTLNSIREKTAVFKAPDFNRFQHSFTHVFGGSYAAGYYSYKWAEVMACDAFSLFKEKGIFDHTTSEKFKVTFLESGGTQDPMDLFVAFRGRKPQVNSLLEQSGII